MGASPVARLNQLPAFPVFVKGSCNVFWENDSQYSPAFCISNHRLFMPTEKRWPVGDTVSVEFRILDEVRKYTADGIIESHGDCPAGILDPGIMIRLDEVHTRKLGFSGRLQQINRAGRIARLVTVGALQYAISEARGNVVARELDEPHAGFRTPVLLIQGWLGTRGVFSILENKLKREGFPVFSFHLGTFNIQDISKSAEKTAEKLKRICASRKIKKVNIVGHSMGGLIGLYALKHFDIAPCVNRLIAVGSPFQGTAAAYAGIATMGLIAKSVWQMVPNSQFIQTLNRAPLPKGVEVFSLMSQHDILAPETSCVLEGAKNMVLSSGHTAIVVDEEVYEVLLILLKGQYPFQGLRSML